MPHVFEPPRPLPKNPNKWTGLDTEERELARPPEKGAPEKARRRLPTPEDGDRRDTGAIDRDRRDAVTGGNTGVKSPPPPPMPTVPTDTDRQTTMPGGNVIRGGDAVGGTSSPSRSESGVNEEQAQI